MKSFLLAITLLTSFHVTAQRELIDSVSFDKELFTKYVLEQTNGQRRRKRADSLQLDPTLLKAAQDHSDYMAKNEIVTHNQKQKIKRQPIDRVIFYNGTHNLVGENVQSMPLDYMREKARNKLTYYNLAREAVKVWRKSKPHYANMIDKNYSQMALGITIKNGQLYLCQVFGSPPFKEEYSYKKGELIKVKNDKPCWNCKRTKKKIFKDEVTLGWYSVSNDSVYYWNKKHYTKYRWYNKKKGKYRLAFKKNNIRKVFGANGVIAIDVIHNEQFECNGNHRYHNSLYHDGYYLGSIDKDRIKRDDIHPSPEIYKVYVGQKPAFKDTFYQVDFNYNKRKQSCMESATIYVQPDHLRPKEYFELPTPTISNKRLIIRDSVIVEIPFERNQTDQDTSIFQPLLLALDSLVKSIDSIDTREISTINFSAAASIEGSEKANRKLFIKRGKLIENYLRRYYPELNFKSEFYENFDDFRSGLASVGYTDLIGFSDDSLRIFANEHRDEEEIESLLDETRISSVRILYRDLIPIEEGTYGLSVQRLKDLIDSRNIAELKPLFAFIATKAIRGDSLLLDELLNLNIPRSQSFSEIHYYQFILSLHADPDKEVRQHELEQLKSLDAISMEDYLEYKLLFNLFNRREILSVDDYDTLKTEIRSKRKAAWMECLRLIMDVQNYNISHQEAVPILLTNVIKRKLNLKQTYFISQYMIEWGYSAQPYILLSKFARRPGRIPKLYKQYIKLGYFLKQFDNDREWKKIKRSINVLKTEDPKEFCELFKWYHMGVRSLEKEEIAEAFCELCREQ